MVRLAMRKYCLLLALVAAAAGHARLPEAAANQIVDAIYRAEGGSRAKVPYGILSVRVSTLEDARAVCYTTVQRNHDRWLKAGRPGEYLDFLADRYCPPSADAVGNKNWKRNVRHFITKTGGSK